MSTLSPKTTKEYDADWDAETLMKAVGIKKDKKRLAAARKVLKAKAKATAEAAKSV